MSPTASPIAHRVQRRGRTVPISVAGSALLLIDVINDLDFPGSRPLVQQAEAMALRLVRLKRKAVNAGVPVIYINDNFGQWRSDFRKTVAHCTAASAPGHLVSRRLRPTARDYFVLKPKHSGFYHTTLDTLLDALHIRRVILTGIAGNICVLFTANDAYMRELKLFTPSDCIVSNTPEDNAHALRQMQVVMKANATRLGSACVSQSPFLTRWLRVCTGARRVRHLTAVVVRASTSHVARGT